MLAAPFAHLRDRLASTSPAVIVAIFTLVNLFNYVDRGIVPGAFDSLGEWIRDDLGVPGSDLQIGLLQSMYVDVRSPYHQQRRTRP